MGRWSPLLLGVPNEQVGFLCPRRPDVRVSPRLLGALDGWVESLSLLRPDGAVESSSLRST